MQSANAGGVNLMISRTDRPQHKKSAPKDGNPTGQVKPQEKQ